MSQKFQQELEALKSERRGIARNESPFAQSSTPPQITKERAEEIERRSMEAWFREQGRPVPPPSAK